MTFRELLQKTNHKEIFNHLYQEYYYKNVEDEVMEMSLSYRRVVDELLSKPSAPQGEWVIEVRASDNCFDDLCWTNPHTKESFGLDLLPWSQIIDARVQIEGDIAPPIVGAHLLYEITFYGFTEEAILKQREELDESAAEERLKWEKAQKEIEKLTSDN
jgi:hypothetical protein